MKGLPELLSPAGSEEALRAAVAAGADAVYLGGGGFNARAYAPNFAGEKMESAIAYCHTFGVKVYVTLNTLLFDRECEEFVHYAAELSRMGADAVIVADLGGVRLLRRYVPDLPVHISTQAGVHSAAGAAEMARLGACRVVLARELSLADITTLTTHAPVETEVFLHGALCVCHSGQCLFSSLVGGRSGNRGECAQPCRLPYNDGRYLLSLRDLSLSSHVPALIDAGVASLKIEGRMKSAAYVYGVTSLYRRLLDERRAATPEENARLAALFSRGGFTDGYFTGRPASPMTGVRSEADKEASRAEEARILPTIPDRKSPLCASALIEEGCPATLTLWDGYGHRVTVTGECPLPARSAPLTDDAVRARLARLGGTPFSLRETDISLSLGEGLNLSPAALNALRRAGVEALTAALTARRAEVAAPPYRPAPAGPGKPFPTVLSCRTTAQAAALRPLCRCGELIFLPLYVSCEENVWADGVALPPVVSDHERPAVLAMMEKARAAGVRYALLPGLGLLSAARECGFELIGDFRLNVTNRESAALLRDLGIGHFLLSPELTLPQIRDIGDGAAVVYGRIPLMLTERCFTRENFGCASCGRAALVDRRGVRFPLLQEYPHRHLVLNSVPTYMGDRRDQLAAAHLFGEVFLFTVESPDEATRVFRNYREGRPCPGECRRIARAPVAAPDRAEKPARPPDGKKPPRPAPAARRAAGKRTPYPKKGKRS